MKEGSPISTFVAASEHQQLQAAVRALLERETDPWPKLCGDVGVAALEIPERFGGVGAGVVETQLVCEELGYALPPCPMLGSVVLAGQALLASGDEDACARLLPGLAEGISTLALAWTGADGAWSTDRPAFHTVDGSLTGTAHYVLDAPEADIVLALADTGDDIGLFEVTGAPEIRRTTAMDATRSLGTVRLENTPARRIGGDFRVALAAVRARAVLALAAEQLGAARACLDRTVDYCKQRVQFGRPVGSFQAVKHRLADVHVGIEAARSACAAAALEADPTGIAIARIESSAAFDAAAAEMIQLHGGIAITWEHEAHRYFKRAHADMWLFGTPEAHLDQLTGAWALTGTR